MDNNTDGFVYNAVAGPGYFAGPGYTGVGRIGEQLFGYATMTPGSSFQKLSQQSVNRFIGSSTANWRPIAWLRATADVGIDLTDRKDYILQRVGEGPTSGTSREGSAVDSRTRIANLTTNVLASATWAARSWAHLRSTVGVQYVGFDLNQTTATGTQLAPGGEAPSQGTVFRLATSSSPSKTLGGYVEEQAAFRDRLFVTAAVRTDRNSAVGVKYGSAYYPKASASWIASDQGLTALPYLTRLRLRAAVGSSGVQPAPTAALRTYTAASVYFGGAATPGLTQSSPGNVNLKPERSTEFETGFDSQWWRDRISAEVTYYHKQTTDALIGTQLPPSVGVGSYFVNLGGVRNEGFEYRLQSQLVDRQSVGWDVTLTGSTNHNMVTAMGDVGPGPFVANRVGKPMWTQFGRRIKYNDANADGLLSLTELTLSDTSDLQYFGSRNAPTQQSLSTGVELLRRRLRITALLDRKSGGRDLNLERQRPCELYDSCFELHRLDASLRDQARAIAVRQYGAQGGYIEATDFTKLREVAATYDLGEALSRRIAAQNARVTLAARNIKTWTKWSGADPEAFTSNNSDSFVNYQNVFTVGAPLYYMLRLDLTF
jgi:outer membrane receptor protein involved in Fe transport